MSSESKSPNKQSATALGLVGFIGVIGAGVFAYTTKNLNTPEVHVQQNLTVKASPMVEGAPDTSKPMPLPALERAYLRPAWAVDVYDTQKLLSLAGEKTWLTEVAKTPLGEGFLGSWAGFLGSRGEDLGASFRGTLLEYVLGSVLDRPFRIAWLSSENDGGVPILVLPNPSPSAITAFLGLDQTIRRGTYTFDRCPTEPEGTRSLEISRWLAADRVVYAMRLESPAVVLIARNPATVQETACTYLGSPAGADLPAMDAKQLRPDPRPEGADLSVVVLANKLGRSPEALATFLGVKASPRLLFAVEGGRLVSRGIGAEVAEGARLTTQAASKNVLAALPKEIPISLVLELAAPATLEQSNLEGWMKSPGAAKEPVTVALLWRPRGQFGTSEVGLVWSRKSDRAELERIFSGPNKMSVSEACDSVVLASNVELSKLVEKACKKEIPSVLHQDPAFAAALDVPSAATLLVHFGSLTRGLLDDAFTQDKRPPAKKGQPPPPVQYPPEIEQALRTLEALPSFGFSGALNGRSWVSRGFRS